MFYSAMLSYFVWCCVIPLPAGTNGILGSSSDRSALIRLLSDDVRHWVRAERLSTLLPLDRGVLNGSPLKSRQELHDYLLFINEEQRRMNKIYLWFEVRRKLRRYFDGIITALRITVLHVCVTFVACVSASVVHIGTCYSQKQKTGFMHPKKWSHSPNICHCFSGILCMHLMVHNNEDMADFSLVGFTLGLNEHRSKSQCQRLHKSHIAGADTHIQGRCWVHT